MSNLKGPWRVVRHGGVVKDRFYVVDCDGNAIGTGMTQTRARQVAELPDLAEIRDLCAGSIERTDINAPEDAVVQALCERIGYGAVMDAAARLWGRKDGVGAFTVGPCRGTVARKS